MMLSEQTHNKQTPTTSQETRTEKKYTNTFLVLHNSTLGFIKANLSEKTNSRNRYKLHMLLWKLSPSHCHGKTPLAQTNLNQSLFVGVEIAHHGISDAKKTQFGTNSFVFLMNVSKGGLQCSHYKNKKVFDLLFFKQMSNLRNPETFDVNKKANQIQHYKRLDLERKQHLPHRF